MGRLPNRSDIAQQLAQHLLPRTRAPEVWGGPGSGLQCDGCGNPIESGDLEYEFYGEIAGAASRKFRMHIECYQVWAAELAELPPTER